jgi:hypothetical protein
VKICATSSALLSNVSLPETMFITFCIPLVVLIVLASALRLGSTLPNLFFKNGTIVKSIPAASINLSKDLFSSLSEGFSTELDCLDKAIFKLSLD